MDANSYPDELKVSEALQIYFARYHFADGGYKDKYFRIKLGPLFIPVPNTTSRIEAVKFHDIHHLLTEYTALWKGEVEIGAWEIASGCGKHLIAWFLNFGSFCVGLFLYPKALFEAFVKGRHVRINLYKGYVYDETLLNKTVGELRKELDVAHSTRTRLSDIIYFILWCLLAASIPLVFAAGLFFLC